ncbi:PepSY domain-containing protein [Colwellia psychrerythraea]|uniref:PepSY domain containing protein n=1 Tax=Colwellia psychrerythraea TaxID=28229 RepID=A0A099L1Z1_COLPS|nr:PepSY domain-containing protein [Colwellia psychrerythraea]KGJ96881.1 PepSY domain containing protein [Colwellia psychrerythraea]
MKLPVFLLVLLMSVLTLSAGDAWSVEKTVNKKVTSSKQAAKIVQNKYGGKVLKVNKQKNNGSYKVKIVKPNGQVVSKKVNAKTGKIEQH